MSVVRVGARARDDEGAREAREEGAMCRGAAHADSRETRRAR